MSDKQLLFLTKVNQMPEEVKFYFGSELISQRINFIINKYQLEKNVFFDFFYDYVLSNFRSYVLDDFAKRILVDKSLLNSLISDVLGIIFLPIAEILNINIEQEIRQHQGDLSKYKKYKEELVELIKKENLNRVEDFLSEYEKDINLEEEENVIRYLFQDKLLDVVKDTNTRTISDLNSGLIYVLNHNKNFQIELINILLKSELSITEKNFILEGKILKPTIANYLNYFIRMFGAGNFDNLTLTRFLTTAPAVKNLSEKEKLLVKKLLLLYRNLKFYPESMADKPEGQWEIIPISKEIDLLAKARQIKKYPMTQQEKKIEELAQVKEREARTELEKQAIDEEIDAEKKIENLKYEAAKFPEGSLERRAIEEEIRKLEN